MASASTNRLLDRAHSMFRTAGSMAAPLPSEQQGQVRRHIAQITAFILAMLLLAGSLLPWGIQHKQASVATGGLFLVLVGSTLGMLATTRLRRITPDRLLWILLGYQAVLALCFALTRHASPWLAGPPQGWSMLAVTLVIFAAVVPQTPRRALAGSLIMALMDPVGLGISIWAGNPVPSERALLHLFGPTAMAVVIAQVVSGIVYRLGRDVQTARRMGSYRLVERLGAGGMGEVWRAEHERLASPAAVKLIPGHVLARRGGAGSATAQRRFELEAKATAMLQSQHTIRLYDYGATSDGTWFYVMELLEGMDLDTLVRRYGPLPPERVFHLLRQVCDSLEEAHRQGFVHRDVKPANIYLCQLGVRCDVVKVLDFGLVRQAQVPKPGDHLLTQDGLVSGTPAFMSPEAVLGEPVLDPRADLYALGCVAYWLLTGQLVHGGATAQQIMIAHAHDPHVPLSRRCEGALPAGLEELVDQCLAKDPADRPPSAQALSDALARIPLDRPWGDARAEIWWERNQPLAAANGPTEVAPECNLSTAPPPTRPLRPQLRPTAVATEEPC